MKKSEREKIEGMADKLRGFFLDMPEYEIQLKEIRVVAKGFGCEVLKEEEIKEDVAKYIGAKKEHIPGIDKWGDDFGAMNENLIVLEEAYHLYVYDRIGTYKFIDGIAMGHLRCNLMAEYECSDDLRI